MPSLRTGFVRAGMKVRFILATSCGDFEEACPIFGNRGPIPAHLRFDQTVLAVFCDSPLRFQGLDPYNTREGKRRLARHLFPFQRWPDRNLGLILEMRQATPCIEATLPCAWSDLA
jgi:hypothetical protein